MTSWSLDGHTGSELYVRDLALALSSKGCRVAIFTLVKGALGREAGRQGLSVVNDPRALDFTPDIIHGHHQPDLVEAMAAWPQTRAVFTVHGAQAPMDEAIVLAGIGRYVAVDRRCLARLEETPNIRPERLRLLLNFVDLSRFTQRPPLPIAPRRALVFSNYASEGGDLAVIREACAGAGVSVDVVGARSGRPERYPELVLPQYDVVFAKARAAIEAMAVGSAAVLFHDGRLGEMVTARRFDALRDWNFGAGVLTRPLTVESVAGELALYSAPDAELVSDRIRREASLDAAAQAWLEVYREAAAEDCAADPSDAAVLDAALSRWRSQRAKAVFAMRAQSMRASPIGEGVYRALRAVGRMVRRP